MKKLGLSIGCLYFFPFPRFLAFFSLFRHSGKYILLVGVQAANEVVDVEAALKSPEWASRTRQSSSMT